MEIHVVGIDLGKSLFPIWLGWMRPEESSSATVARAHSCWLSQRTFAFSVSAWRRAAVGVFWLAHFNSRGMKCGSCRHSM